MFFDDNIVKTFYAGVSICYHHFFNREKLTKQKRKEITNLIGFPDNPDCINLNIDNDGYLDIIANVRKGIVYNSPLYYLEKNEKGFLDSLCNERSVSILKNLSEVSLGDISGINLSLNYGLIYPEIRYDSGGNSITSVLNYKPYPFLENEYWGFSRKFLKPSTVTIYKIRLDIDKYDLIDFKQETKGIIESLDTKNFISDYLKYLYNYRNEK